MLVPSHPATAAKCMQQGNQQMCTLIEQWPNKLLTLVTQVAGTHGTVRLDDFVIPYRPDKASFLVTNNHGFTDLDLGVKTETEERVVCTHMQPGCKRMVKHDRVGGKVITCCAALH